MYSSVQPSGLERAILEFLEAKKDGNWIMLIFYITLNNTAIVHDIVTTKVLFSWKGPHVLFWKLCNGTIHFVQKC